MKKQKLIDKERTWMTNRQAHEEAAGMGLENMFFWFNNINPNAEYKDKNDTDMEYLANKKV